MARETDHRPLSSSRTSSPSDHTAWLNLVRDSYLERTSRPIYAIAFLLPFIVFYEVGTFLINTDVLNSAQIRVVAFVWLQDMLHTLGYTGRLAWIAPPLLVIAILLGLQISSRKAWYVSGGDFLPMAVESTLLAIPLIVLSLFLNSAASQAAPGHAALQVATGTVTDHSLWANMITGVGAGIYEELVFRLILICVLIFLFQDIMRMSRKNAILLAVLVSAALFSGHHHVTFLNGELGRIASFDWAAFSFRTLAGVYFAVLYAIRGFGITAGTHAFYDILATFLNAFFFARET